MSNTNFTELMRKFKETSLLDYSDRIIIEDGEYQKVIKLEECNGMEYNNMYIVEVGRLIIDKENKVCQICDYDTNVIITISLASGYLSLDYDEIKCVYILKYDIYNEDTYYSAYNPDSYPRLECKIENVYNAGDIKYVGKVIARFSPFDDEQTGYNIHMYENVDINRVLLELNTFIYDFNLASIKFISTFEEGYIYDMDAKSIFYILNYKDINLELLELVEQKSALISYKDIMYKKNLIFIPHDFTIIRDEKIFKQGEKCTLTKTELKACKKLLDSGDINTRVNIVNAINDIISVSKCNSPEDMSQDDKDILIEYISAYKNVHFKLSNNSFIKKHNKLLILEGDATYDIDLDDAIKIYDMACALENRLK